MNKKLLGLLEGSGLQLRGFYSLAERLVLVASRADSFRSVQGKSKGIICMNREGFVLIGRYFTRLFQDPRVQAACTISTEGVDRETTETFAARLLRGHV
jgi:hypothetical protein